MTALASEQTARGHSRKEQLLLTAEQQFGEKGFAGTSVRDIAAAASVNIGSIYNFFDDKRGLYSAVLERIFRRFLAYLEVPDLTDDDPVENLRRILGAVACFFEDHPMAHRVMVQELLIGSEQMDLALGHLTRARSRIIDVLRVGTRTGVFREMDENLVTFGLINGVIGYFLSRGIFYRFYADRGPPDETFRDNLPFPLFKTVVKGLLREP